MTRILTLVALAAALDGCCGAGGNGGLPAVDFIAVREAQLRSPENGAGQPPDTSNAHGYPLPLTPQSRNLIVEFLLAGGSNLGIEDAVFTQQNHAVVEKRWGALLNAL